MQNLKIFDDSLFDVVSNNAAYQGFSFVVGFLLVFRKYYLLYYVFVCVCSYCLSVNILIVFSLLYFLVLEHLSLHMFLGMVQRGCRQLPLRGQGLSIGRHSIVWPAQGLCAEQDH